MPDETPPLPPQDRPAAKPPHPPIPGRLWLGFIIAPILIATIIGMMIGSPGDSGIGAGFGALGGLGGATILCGGLGLSGKFYTTDAGRVFGGILFGFLILLGLVGVVFVGCICTLSGQRHY